MLIAIATARIALTYPVFSHTHDEPSHLACGMEWLDRKAYALEHQHPPLARAMVALGPYLAGERSHGQPDMMREGAAILGTRTHYDRVLMLARIGTVPFLWIAALVVYAWSRRYFGATVAVMAVFMFTQLPGILAHSGLATTDMAVTAFVGATVYTTLVWLEEPTWRHTLVAGSCLGLAVLSKFSALFFVPAALLAMLGSYLVTERPSLRTLLRLARPRVALLPLGLLVAALVIWAGYRFSFGRVHFADLWLPAPELYHGIAVVIEHHRQGHATYLMGRHGQGGWWYFFPVALAVKTPLPFLFLALGGAVLAVQRTIPARLPLAYSIGLLLCAMPSRINIGTRHLLVIYIGLAILGAVFAVEAMRRWRTRSALAGVVVALLAGLAALPALSHPDYLPYFNALAGRQPEKILVGSDLDWGQDLKRLARRLQGVGAREFAGLPPSEPQVREYIVTSLAMVDGLPIVRDIDPVTPSPGWNAVSLTNLFAERMGLRDEHAIAPWPERIEPMERVGKGILLYYFPPAYPP